VNKAFEATSKSEEVCNYFNGRGINNKSIETFKLGMWNYHGHKRLMIPVFDKYGEVDGLRPEIWDLYANFYQELDLNKNNIEEKIKGYKFLVELRMKEIRTIMVKNINWEKDDKVKDVLSNVTNVIRKLVENIEKIYEENKDIKKDEDYIKDKIFYVNGIDNKIKKSNEEINNDSNNIQPEMV
jgi:DNA repair ATPase RecN